MLATANTTNQTRFLVEDQLVKAEYFFSNASTGVKGGKTHKILVEISFTHPLTGDKIDLRVIKSILILCQPQEVIDAVVQREIKEFLQLFPSVEASFETASAQALVKQTTIL